MLPTHCTLHTTNTYLHLDYILHTAHHTLHTAQYTLHTTHSTVHTAQYTLHTTHYTYTLQSVPIPPGVPVSRGHVPDLFPVSGSFFCFLCSAGFHNKSCGATRRLVKEPQFLDKVGGMELVKTSLIFSVFNN